MRIHCFCCGKSVSTEVPEETILRAVAYCPECLSGADPKMFEFLIQQMKAKAKTAGESLGR